MSRVYGKACALAEKNFLRADFDNGILDDSFEQSFIGLPTGFIHVQIKYRRSISHHPEVDNFYGTGVLRMFNRLKNLVSLRDRGVATVTVEPYKGRTLGAYLNSTWNNPQLW